MGMKIGLDTNIFLAIRNREPNYLICKKIIDAIQIEKETTTNQMKMNGFLSTIVVAEILVGFYKKRDLVQLNEFLTVINKYYTIIPVSLEISNESAQLRAETEIKLPDALIAISYQQAKVDIFISNDFKLKKKLGFDVLKPEQFVDQYLVSEE